MRQKETKREHRQNRKKYSQQRNKPRIETQLITREETNRRQTNQT